MQSLRRYLLLGGATAAIAYFIYRQIRAHWLNKDINHGLPALESDKKISLNERVDTPCSRPYRSPVYYSIGHDLNKYGADSDTRLSIMSMLDDVEEKNIEFHVKSTMEKLLGDVENMVSENSTAKSIQREVKTTSEAYFLFIKDYLPDDFEAGPSNVKTETKKKRKPFKKTRRFFRNFSCIRKAE